MKKFLTGEKNRTKKNTTEKMTTPMPMGRKQKKWMSLYMALVLTVTVGATTAFAAGDPYVRQRNPGSDYGVSLFEKVYQETAGVPEGTPAFKSMFREVKVFER